MEEDTEMQQQQPPTHLPTYLLQNHLDLFHIVLRKLPPRIRAAVRASCHTLRTHSDHATVTLKLPYHQPVPAPACDMGTRFPNVRHLCLQLQPVNTGDMLAASAAWIHCSPRFMACMRTLTIQHMYTQTYARFTQGVLQCILSTCAQLTTVQLIWDELGPYNEKVALTLNIPPASYTSHIPALQHMLNIPLKGVHMLHGPLVCSNMVALRLDRANSDILSQFNISECFTRVCQARHLTSLSLKHVAFETLPPAAIHHISCLTALKELTIWDGGAAAAGPMQQGGYNDDEPDMEDEANVPASVINPAVYGTISVLTQLVKLHVWKVPVPRRGPGPVLPTPFTVPPSWTALTRLQDLELSGQLIWADWSLSSLSHLTKLKLSNV